MRERPPVNRNEGQPAPLTCPRTCGSSPCMTKLTTQVFGFLLAHFSIRPTSLLCPLLPAISSQLLHPQTFDNLMSAIPNLVRLCLVSLQVESHPSCNSHPKTQAPSPSQPLCTFPCSHFGPKQLAAFLEPPRPQHPQQLEPKNQTEKRGSGKRKRK